MPAGGRREERGEDLDEGGLAGAVRSQEAEQFPPPNDQVYVPQGDDAVGLPGAHVPEAVLAAEPLGLDGAIGCGHEGAEYTPPGARWPSSP